MTTRVISQRIDAEYERHRHDVFSQTGEDGLIAHFMSRIGVEKGYFVEFGAWDGKHLSNCANLAQNGWSGCFIEGDSERFVDLEKNYADNPAIRGVNCFVMAEGDDRLDSILSRIGAPAVIDVLSIDIDGYDYAVWESLKDHKPRLVVVEYNPTIPATVVHIQDEHDQTCFGNSLAAFWELGLTRGYRLVASTDWNAFFLPEEDCERFGIRTYFPWEVKDNKYETQFFHGYNGVVKIAGVDSLLWHGVGLDERKMQPLPETLRKIPVGQRSAFFEELEIFKAKISKNADG